VVDGNVMRVVARLQADSGDIASVRTRERFRSIAQAWLDRKQPGAFNQAFMELGATVCLPKNPLCPVCPLSTCCLARQQGIAAQLPVKLRKTDPVKIAAVLLLVRKGGRLLLRRTEAGARQMAGFWELPSPEQLPGARIGKTLGEFRHTITHHHYTFTVKTASGRPAGAEFGWFTAAQLADIPLSTMARKALRLARNP
jgi:A/G-specific adenine glycosylase